MTALPIVIVVIILLMCRWAWRAMKRSHDPAAQEAVQNFEAAVADLKAALKRKVR